MYYTNSMAKKIFATNKRAYFDYAIQDTFIAGIVLAGHEVKSIRAGNVSLRGSFVTVSPRNEVWLHNMHVRHYAAASLKAYDPTAQRKLLLSKSEIRKLSAARQAKLNIIPIDIHVSGSFIKATIAIAKSKKKIDKRNDIKKRDTERSANQKFRR